MKEEINKEILKRYFDHTCSEEERIRVEKWLDHQEIWNAEGSSTTDSHVKEKIWAGILDQAYIEPTTRHRIIRFLKYASASAAAAVILFFLNVSKEDELLSAIRFSSPALEIEKLHYQTNANPQNGTVGFYKLANTTNSPIVVTTTSNGRNYTLEQHQTYLTIRLEDPGVMGDQVLILSAEQMKMIPDVPLAGQLASIVNKNNLKAATSKYL